MENLLVSIIIFQYFISLYPFQHYAYVYDGIPKFVSGTDSGYSSGVRLLAAVCGWGLPDPISVEAKSGFMTVFFEGNLEGEDLKIRFASIETSASEKVSESN